ncbi:MAG: hypothetical protein B7733_26410 [Myxococcales bacterium FL481]|nr:MAG: hypothetical protein B7733_26410 [Myxococcales bacterium FL481]
MNHAYAIFPLILGVFAVLQAALNRKILGQLGLTYAVILNASVLLIVASTFAAIVRFFPDAFPGDFRGRLALSSVRWWFFIPGCCGFLIVSGIPWLMGKIGALSVFVSLVAAQVVASAAWDAVFEGQPVSASRIAGSLLAIAAVALVSWK